MTSPAQYEELSLSSVAGLQVVFRNIQTLYQRGIATEAELLIPSQSPEATTFHKTYSAVRATVERLIAVMESGATLSSSDAASLQVSYDSFISAGAALDRYRKVPSPALTAEPRAVTASAEVAAPPAPRSNVLPIPPKVTHILPTPAVTKAESIPVVPSRTSAKLTVSPAISPVPEEGEPRKKKRRRKKKSTNLAATRPQLHSGQSSPRNHASRLDVWNTICSINVEATHLYQDSLQDLHIDTDDMWDSAAQTLLAELATIVQEAKDIAVSETVVPYGKEKLSHYHTLALTVLEELRAMAEEVRVTYPQTTVPESDVVSIPISSAVVLAPVPVKSEESTPRVSFVPSTITTTKHVASVQRSVPKQLVSLTRPDPIHQPFSLTAQYLTAPRYRAHIASYYSSETAFERLLDASVTTLEATTIDGIERWLGDTPASAFHYIKDLSLQDFTALAQQPYESITVILRAENIKYETFLVWRDLFDEMMTVLSLPPTASYGQLFAQFMIEEDIASLQSE